MRWRPTHAQVRAICAAAVLLAIAVLLRRPDAAVFGLPLAFVAVWGRYFRPREQPEVRTELDADVLFEGQATTYRLRVSGTVDPDIDLIVAALPRSEWFQYDPPQAAIAEPVTERRGDARGRAAVEAVGPACVGATNGRGDIGARRVPAPGDVGGAAGGDHAAVA